MARFTYITKKTCRYLNLGCLLGKRKALPKVGKARAMRVTEVCLMGNTWSQPPSGSRTRLGNTLLWRREEDREVGDGSNGFKSKGECPAGPQFTVGKLISTGAS